MIGRIWVNGIKTRIKKRRKRLDILSRRIATRMKRSASSPIDRSESRRFPDRMKWSWIRSLPLSTRLGAFFYWRGVLVKSFLIIWILGCRQKSIWSKPLILLFTQGLRGSGFLCALRNKKSFPPEPLCSSHIALHPLKSQRASLHFRCGILRRKRRTC